MKCKIFLAAAILSCWAVNAQEGSLRVVDYDLLREAVKVEPSGPPRGEHYVPPNAEKRKSMLDEVVEQASGTGEEPKYLMIPEAWFGGSSGASENEGRGSSNGPAPGSDETTHGLADCLFSSKSPAMFVGLFGRTAEADNIPRRLIVRYLSDKESNLKFMLSNLNESEVAAADVRLVTPSELQKLKRALHLSSQSIGDILSKPKHEGFLLWLLDTEHNSHYLMLEGYKSGPPNSAYAIPCSPSTTPAIGLTKETIQNISSALDFLASRNLEVSVEVKVKNFLYSQSNLAPVEVLLLEHLAFYFHSGAKHWRAFPTGIVSDGSSYEVELQAPQTILDENDVKLGISAEQPFWIRSDIGLSLTARRDIQVFKEDLRVDVYFGKQDQQMRNVDLLNHSLDAQSLVELIKLSAVSARSRQLGVEFNLGAIGGDPGRYFDGLDQDAFEFIWRVPRREQGIFKEKAIDFFSDLREAWRSFQLVHELYPCARGDVLIQQHVVPKSIFARKGQAQRAIEYASSYLESVISQADLGWSIDTIKMDTSDARLENTIHVRLALEGDGLGVECKHRHD